VVVCTTPYVADDPYAFGRYTKSGHVLIKGERRVHERLARKYSDKFRKEK